MKNGDANRTLLSAYRHSIARYQTLLKTHTSDVERNYIKARLSAYQAAVHALIGSDGLHALERGTNEEIAELTRWVMSRNIASCKSYRTPPC
jgi:hypothetical protein